MHPDVMKMLRTTSAMEARNTLVLCNITYDTCHSSSFHFDANPTHYLYLSQLKSQELAPLSNFATIKIKSSSQFQPFYIIGYPTPPPRDSSHYSSSNTHSVPSAPSDSSAAG
jgi:hypothetical protein